MILYFILHGVQDGCDKKYLDIGSNNEENSVCIPLKNYGWSGYHVDMIDSDITDNYIKGDATTLDYSFVDDVNYLSIDVDDNTTKVLDRINWDWNINWITIEHDAYRFGDEFRTSQREILLSKGFVMICEDVYNEIAQGPYEDWWVSKDIEHLYEEYKCKNKTDKELYEEFKHEYENKK